MDNSQNQVNESYSAYRDRRNYEKSYFLWCRIYGADPESKDFCKDDMQSFALFFAQRVKGGKL